MASEPTWPDTQRLLSALANIQMEPTRLTSRAIISPWRAAHLAGSPRKPGFFGRGTVVGPVLVDE